MRHPVYTRPAALLYRGRHVVSQGGRLQPIADLKLVAHFHSTAAVYVLALRLMSSSTAILSETYRISSELRSQATASPVSATVGDHVGIRGAVGSSSSFAILGYFWGLFLVRNE